MKLVRLLLILLSAASLGTALSASAAYGALPEFKPTGSRLTIKSGALTIKSATNDVIACETSELPGDAENGHEFLAFDMHLTGCNVSTNKGETYCAAIQGGSPSSSGLIQTFTVRAALGLALPSKTAGLLILPAGMTKFVELESSCTAPILLNGSFAGLVSPVGKSQTTGKVTYSAPGGRADITEIALLGGSVKPNLLLTTVKALVEAEASVTYSAATEVT